MNHLGISDNRSLRDSTFSDHLSVEGVDPQKRDSSSRVTTTRPNQRVSLETFRALLGIPDGILNTPHSSGGPPPPNRTQTIIKPLPVKALPSIFPGFLWGGSQRSGTSVYCSLVLEERKISKRYVNVEILIFSCMVMQLLIASILIVLGAIARDYHIAVAILGAVTGILAGLLSIIKGQGQPNRLLQYRNGLRKVMEDIEFLDHELRVSAREVTYSEVIGLRDAYTHVREDARKNHPNIWAVSSHPKEDHTAMTNSSPPPIRDAYMTVREDAPKNIWAVSSYSKEDHTARTNSSPPPGVTPNNGTQSVAFQNTPRMSEGNFNHV